MLPATVFQFNIVASHTCTVSSLFNKQILCSSVICIYIFSHYKIKIMSVLIFVDHADGQVKKSSYEALTYGSKIAAQIGTTAEALLLGTVADDLSTLGKYGVTKVHQVANETLNHVDAQLYSKVIAEVLQQVMQQF